MLQLKTMSNILSYSELIKLDNWYDRLLYLQQRARLTNGGPHDINQTLFRGDNGQWIRTRDEIIRRDNGSDLGVLGCDIEGRILVHHINPLTVKDIQEWNVDKLYNPENLICCSYKTHGMIHFGLHNEDESIAERSRGDTKLW